MEIDLERHEPRAEPFRAQVCIIGGGIAGLTLAHKLSGRGIQVALLEAGGHTLEPASQSVYQASMGSQTHTGTHDGRFRMLGGSSTRWGGQLLPYTEDIFQPQPGVPSQPWPIALDQVAPFYPEAQRLLSADDLPFEAAELYAALGHAVPPLLAELPELRVRFSKWAPFSSRNLASSVAPALLAPANARAAVYLHANATELLLNRDGTRIIAVLVRNYAGTRFRFEADHFVLAAGTIETSRLLLASGSVAPAGVGNAHDVVGRYFHDHLSVPAVTLTGPARRQLLEYFAPFLVRGTAHTAKLEASSSLRGELALLAVMAHITVEEPEDSGAGVARALLQSIQRGDLRSALRQQLPKLPRASAELLQLAAAAKLRRRRFVSPRATVTLRLDSEQLPRPEVRIRIDRASTDHLGLPRTVVDWSISPAETATLRHFAAWLRERFAAVGLSPISWRPELFEQDAELTGITDTYHPMGGARMGTDPRSSVVDPDLTVHGVANLSVASAATFPAGGSSNPTFTLMALTLRLAERLSAQLSH